MDAGEWDETTEDRLHSVRGELARFALQVSHDLTNSIGTIRGFAELLVEDSAGDETLQTTARRIVTAAERTLDTLGSAVAAARSNVMTHAPDDVDLATEVVAAREALTSRLTSAAVRVELVGSAHAPGSARKLRQVFAAVLDNVIVHAPGSIATVTFEHAGDRLFIRVADEGPGIAPTEVERVVAPGPAGRIGGLATARRLVEDHGGRMWLTSRSGAGLTVHIALPTPVGAGSSVGEGAAG